MAKRTTSAGRPDEDAIQGPDATSIIPIEHVQSKILLIRGQKVILDADLAKLYGVATGRLNEQVKRNIERFPPDFAFRLSEDEFADLKSHFATSRSGWGGRRKLPYAFTEHGAIMAASVLNSERAVQASVFVVRAFVRLKRIRTPSAPNNQSSIIHNQSPRALRLPTSQKELNASSPKKTAATANDKNDVENVPDPVSVPQKFGVKQNLGPATRRQAPNAGFPLPICLFCR